MQRKHSWKRLTHLLICLSFVTGLLLPTTAFADDKGKSKSASAGAQAQTQAPKKDDDKKEPPKSQASTQTSAQAQAPAKKDDDDKPKGQAQSNTQAQVSKQDDKKSGNLPGGTMGNSGSNPDGGGVDKPYRAAGQEPNTQANPANTGKHLDGNNGCGQDKKLEPREDDFGQKHIGWDDNNGWCGKPPEHQNVGKKDEGVAGTTSVPVDGCFEWKDSGKRFFIDEEMTEDEARDFKRSTHFISDSMEDCKPAEKVEGKVHLNDAPEKMYICHRTGSMTNPFVLIEVSVHAEGHDDADADHKGHQGDIHFGKVLPNNWQEICKLPEVGGEVRTESFPLSGCFYNPVTKEFVYFDVQTFSTQAAVDAKIQGLVPQTMDKANCKPQPTVTLGVQDDKPNPGPTGGNPAPVDMYGCFQKSDGTYVHESRTFSSQAEMDAYKASQGYVGIDASRPNPGQCKNPDRLQGPPTEVAGIQTEPGPTIVTTIAVAEREPFPSLVVPRVEIDSPVRVITTAEAREEMPVVGIAPPAAVLSVIDEGPAPVAPQVITPQQPAPRPTTTLLPTTGQPLIDLALLTVGFLGLAVVGLRFLRIGAHRI